VKSSHLSALALTAALAFLAPALSAQAPSKTPPPSGLTPAQTEDRIKQLEARVDAAEKAAASAALEKDYITRVQKQYESYYEKAFNTQIIIVTIIALLVGLVGKFGVDRIIQSKLSEASVQLRTEFKQELDTELQKLKEANAADIGKLTKVLTAQIDQLEEDLKVRSDFQFRFARGSAAAAAEEYLQSVDNLRRALTSYVTCKNRQLIPREEGTTALKNLLLALRFQDEATFADRAKVEFTNPLYDDLADELAALALVSDLFAPVIKQKLHPTP